MENSTIEWTDHTVNFWSGCTKVSPACAHCYAEAFARRNGIFGGWGPGAPRAFHGTGARGRIFHWNQLAGGGRFLECPDCGRRRFAKGRIVTARDECCGRPGRSVRPRIFVNSMSDWLDPEVPTDWLLFLLETIRLCRYLDFQLLTKRPEAWKPRLATLPDDPLHQSEYPAGLHLVHAWLNGTPPDNAWIGTTVEDQPRAVERIPRLLQIPARVHFLSCEPLLGPVDLGNFLPHEPRIFSERNGCKPFLDWIIAGGESGHHARPSHPAWFRSLRDQATAASVPFLFKQWGEWMPRGPSSLGYPSVDGVPTRRVTDTGGNGSISGTSGDNDTWMQRAGKTNSGRHLDGVLHNTFPTLRKSHPPPRLEKPPTKTMNNQPHDEEERERGANGDLLPVDSDTPETDQEELHRGGDGNHHDYVKADFARRLERERDALEYKLATGIHSCGDNCQRPMCVLRRERDEWREKAEHRAIHLKTAGDALESTLAAIRNLRDVKGRHNTQLATERLFALIAIVSDAAPPAASDTTPKP